MKNIISIVLSLIVSGLQAQTEIEKRVAVRAGDKVVLDFKYANNIIVHTWENEEVFLAANVSINNGALDHMYEIESRKSGNRIEFYSNSEDFEDAWRTIYSSDDCCKSYGTHVDITINLHMPAYLDLEYNSISGSIVLPALKGKVYIDTISGDVTMNPGDNRIKAKTVSGDIELLINYPLNADFEVSTVTGEIYSNLDFQYLDGKEGLNQLVGQEVKGRINDGGTEWRLKTVSGDVFLRQL